MEDFHPTERGKATRSKKMSLLAIIIPVGFAGLLAGAEYHMARHSKWDVLSQRFRNTSAPPNPWRGCRFVQMEIQEGNRLKRTTYGHSYSRSAMDQIWAQMFPKVLVSIGPAGLYLKRQPWNFQHHQILIPWSRFASVQTISGTQHVTESVGRQLGIGGEQFRAKMPNVLNGAINTLAGDIVELRLADPKLRIDLPAQAVGNWEQYAAAKPKAPARQESSLVGAK
jgi:hypothetical protein